MFATRTGKTLAAIIAVGAAIVVAFIFMRAPEDGAVNAPAVTATTSDIVTTASLGPAALTGIVSSEAEGLMEGVLVTVKQDGATMSTTVISDAQGRYAFPASRVGSGHYTLRIRAIGYYLDGPREVEIGAGEPTLADVHLNTTDNIAPQMTNAEWLMSFPGTDSEKFFMGRSCQGCHRLQLITTSSFSVDEFKEIVPRMGRYYPGSRPNQPQVLPPGPRANRGITNEELVNTTANYLARVNLNENATWDYELQAMPRPTGRGTSAIITTYDLPRRAAMAHDAIMVKGKVYYSDFGNLYMGELDPVTGEVVDYELPVMKPGAPRGLLGLHPDRDENLWLAMMYQGGLMRFNTETKEITTFPLPIEWQNGSTQQSMVSPRNWHVDGKVWTNDQSDHTFMRLDVATGTYEKLPFLLDQHGEPINGYEIPSDQYNNLWALEFGGRGTRIGMVDAKTHKLTTWRSPFPRAQARRGQFDEDGILWFAEFGANAIGRFDPETQQLREWVLPTKWIMPYDAVKDGRGDIWTGSMGSDRVVRLNPETGEFVEYLLPAYTNIRRVFFDDDTRSFWTGANHTNHSVRLEPLD